jgi:hypothetical protein
MISVVGSPEVVHPRDDAGVSARKRFSSSLPQARNQLECLPKASLSVLVEYF